MKVLDIILLILLAIGAYSGYKKGLFLEIVTFLALIIAIISSFKLLNTGIEFLKKSWGWESVLIPFICFILIFCLVFFGIHLFGKALKKVMDYTLLGTADNFAGAGLGILKMAFGVSILLWLATAASLEFPKEYTEGSFIFMPLVEFAPTMVHWVSYVIPFQDIFPSIKKVLQ